MGPAGKLTIDFVKQRDDVYQRRFGDANRVFHEIPTTLIPHIDVFEYYRTDDEGRVCVLATSGMSDLAMTLPVNTDRPRRVELIFYCSETSAEYAEAMRQLAHFPHDQNTWLGAFHSFANGDPPIPMWGSKILDTFLFLPPPVAEDQSLGEQLILDGDPVEFLWIVPVTTAESILKLTMGHKAILDLLDENSHPYVFNPNRTSYV